jgi:hypothetical protein
MMKMKFGKLLAAGKSWVGGNGTGRYQMRDGLALPKFISPRNPFKRESVVEQAAPPSVAAAPAQVSEVVPVNVPVSVTESPIAIVARTSWLVRLRALAKLAGEWLHRAALFCLDHNPFSAIGRPKLSGIPRFGKTAMQGELSLDKVKVVRSDLTHADLEVVRMSAGQK